MTRNFQKLLIDFKTAGAPVRAAFAAKVSDEMQRNTHLKRYFFQERFYG